MALPLVLDRQAAGGHALVGAECGCSTRIMRMRTGFDIEFVGGDLQQRGGDALADLDLAGRDRIVPSA